MKTGLLSLGALVLVVLASSCTRNSVTSASNPYRDGTAATSITPGAEGTGTTARDILRDVEVSDDFYRTEEEMWKEHEQNRRRVERKYRWFAWLKKKPQYSNPEYYGHRRKPKIRPVGKRRLCRECGIVH